MTRKTYPNNPGKEYATIVVTETKSHSHSTHDFGAVDKKGRKIGSRIYYIEHTNTEVDETEAHGRICEVANLGLWYTVEYRATRDGLQYGSRNGASFRTAEERDAAKAKYLKGAAKRAPKIGAN